MKVSMYESKYESVRNQEPRPPCVSKLNHILPNGAAALRGITRTYLVVLWTTYCQPYNSCRNQHKPITETTHLNYYGVHTILSVVTREW